MNQYALIGFPLEHSFSPQIHERLFALEGIDAAYELCAFQPEQLQSTFGKLRNLQGFNITIPYKQAIIPYLDQLDEQAQLYGSVNVVYQRNGSYIGGNTDCGGFLRAMQMNHFSLDTSVCILGSGGVGRMFAIECARQGAAVTIAVRKKSLDKAQKLADEIAEKTEKTVKIQDVDTLSDSFGLLINATPVGMYPNVQESPISREALQQIDAVFDCIYNPKETLLLQDARELGKKTVGGMDMLVWQAVISHEIWNKTKFSENSVSKIIDDMNQLLEGRTKSNE